MKFNKIWTKEINRRYIQMMKDKKSLPEIKEELKNYIDFHPNNKFKTGGVLSWVAFNEITYNPKWIYFTYNFFPSLQYKNEKDYICYFNINDIDYILKLEYLIENNELFTNQHVTHISFTTKVQYDKFLKEYNKIIKQRIPTSIDFDHLKNIYEDETNFGDIHEIFGSISFILLSMSKQFQYDIYMIGETDKFKKIHYYLKSIEDSFKQFKRLDGNSKFFPNKKTYYYILES